MGHDHLRVNRWLAIEQGSYQIRRSHYNRHRASPGFIGLGETANDDYRSGIRISRRLVLWPGVHWGGP